MCDPLPMGKKINSATKKNNCQVKKLINDNKIVIVAIIFAIFGLTEGFFESKAKIFTAKASTQQDSKEFKISLFEEKDDLIVPQEGEISPSVIFGQKGAIDGSNEIFAKKIYEIVGEAPIKEMVPYISKRDDRVAAFLIGIAKKESSFGYASPSKDGKTCYNYWGYKGSAGRGTGMGYACFASAEEAVTIVGNRIEVLIEKNRSTPAKMVDTWKCGTSCKGDPGAPGWVSTVALYFDKLVNKNS